MTVLPSDVATRHVLAVSSKAARSMRVLSAISGRRLKRSATWLAYLRISGCGAAGHRRMNRNTACFRHRSGRRDTDSSTRCRLRHRPAHRPGPLVPARAICAAYTCPQIPRRPRRHRKSHCLRRGFCRKAVARRTFELPRIFRVLPTAFYPRARKRKRQKSPAGLHILRRGMHCCGVSSTTRRKTERGGTRLAFVPMMG